MKIYFIPGLGFDRRIFQNLELVGADMEYIDWIEPISLNENIKAYATRLATQIEQHSDGTILIGHSFGGVISQEIAQIKRINKIILISSIKSRNELPFNFKILWITGLYKFFTKQLAVKTFKFWGSYQGYKSNEEKELFVDMVSKQSNKYLQWALGRLSVWSNPKSLSGTDIVHVHGDLDKTFPISLIKKPNFIIPNGDHFMVYKQARKLSEILNKEIVYLNGVY
jgi:pimeloyl-ACP methyl ester carboxylesterase